MVNHSKHRSQNIGISKSKVKFDFYTVRTHVIPILKGIEVKLYPAKIGRAHGWSKQHVAYYVKKLEKAGLIRSLKHNNTINYELTKRGQNFLISCEVVLLSSSILAVNLLNCYSIVSTPKRVIDNSPGEDGGELDRIRRGITIEYFLMPEQVKRFENQFDKYHWA